jgi:hypothetical protein
MRNDTGEDFQQCGFAAARWADKTDKFTFRYGKTDILERVDLALSFGTIGFPEIFDMNRR